MTHQLSVDTIARLCHEANRAYQMVLGEEQAPAWDDLGFDTQEGVRHGVRVIQEGNSPEELHRQWVMVKEALGWVHGDTKDYDAKTHPNLGIDYSELPEEERAKDHLFAAIVKVFSNPLP